MLRNCTGFRGCLMCPTQTLARIILVAWNSFRSSTRNGNAVLHLQRTLRLINLGCLKVVFRQRPGSHRNLVRASGFKSMIRGHRRAFCRRWTQRKRACSSLVRRSRRYPDFCLVTTLGVYLFFSNEAP